MSSPRTTSAPTASSSASRWPLAGVAAGGTGLGLASEGGITIEMSDSQASGQDRPYQQEVTLTNPPSWGYDLAGGRARLPGLPSCPARWPAGCVTGASLRSSGRG